MYKGDGGSLDVIKEFYLCTNPVSKTSIEFLKIEFGIYVLDQASTSAPVKCSRVQNNILIFLDVRRKCSIKYTFHLTRFMTSLKLFQGKRVNNLVEIAYLKIIIITVAMISFPINNYNDKNFQHFFPLTQYR